MLAFTVQFSRYGRNKDSLGASAPRESRPFESAPIESGCFLRTQQCARSLLIRQALVPQPPEGRSVLTELLRRRNRIASAPLESMDAQSRIR